MNTEKKVYQVWSNVGNQSVLKYENTSLKEVGYYQGKLIEQGVASWLQVKTKKEELCHCSRRNPHYFDNDCIPF